MKSKILPAIVFLLLFFYIGIFAYLNLAKYTQHVDSDIAADAMLAREIWEEKTLTPDSWISSTERRIVGTPALSALFYGMSGSMVFSMGLACVIVGGFLLAAIAWTFRRCQISCLGTATALLALCALPINGIRNEGQLVPFVTLVWFLFADYYAMHCICLFLCIAFYLYLHENPLPATSKERFRCALVWLLLLVFCTGLALGGMRCLQVVILPLTVWEILLLFFESDHMSRKIPKTRWRASFFILSLLATGAMAKLYPSSVNYPVYLQDSGGMMDRLTHEVPASILECLGISGNCIVNSFPALMQLGILAVLMLVIYGLFFLFGTDKNTQKPRMNTSQRMLIQALGTSFLFTVLIETVTTAETAHNYFFVVWFVIISVLAVLITYFEKTAPGCAKLIIGCVCLFAVCNFFYTYRHCITVKDNLQEYEEVISYMESEEIDHGYAEFWDASRICIMTDGDITMGHCYDMGNLHMYWWLTSTKWYVPNLPDKMPTAYVVRTEDKEFFEAQFEDSSIVTLGFENEKFAVYTSDHNLVPMT